MTGGGGDDGPRAGRFPDEGAALAVDAHAHFHPSYGAVGFLDAAVRNVRRWRLAGDGGARPCLLLADPAGRDSLAALSEALGPDARWELRETGEEETRLAVRRDGPTVVLVAGRQVVTGEKLEVLALATGADLSEGRPAAETVDASLEAGAVTVLPWGFGKWWLRRGRVARRLMETVDDPRFFLGDNGGRPRGAPEPDLFRAARRRGIQVLPGSDPLPFAEEAGRVGSYGFLLPAARAAGPPADDEAAPGATAAQLRRTVAELEVSPPVCGRRVGTGRFLRLQLRMQLRKRGGR